MVDPRFERALRADVGDVRLASATFYDADEQQSIDRFEEVIETYRLAHRGPDITAIVEAGRAVVVGFRTTVAGLDELRTAFRTGVDDLVHLEGLSDAIWRDAQALTPTEIDASPDLLIELEERVETLRREEDRILDRLSTAAEIAPTGSDVTLDLARVTDVIERAVLGVTDPEALFQLHAALAASIDYRDGDFDTSATQREQVRARFDALLAGGADGDTAVALAFHGEPAFVDALINELDRPGAGRDGIEPILDAVEQAMIDGAAPEEAGLSPDLFPPAYVELKVLESELNGPLRDQLDAASGWVWLHDLIDVEDDPEARADAQLLMDANEARQAELRAILGIGGTPGIERDGQVSLGGVAELLIEHGGAPTLWVGRFAANLQERGGDNWGGTNQADVVEIDRVASYIGNDDGAALAFYNQLGAEDSARLVLTYQDGMRPTFTALGDGLGRAAATGELDFDGAEYAAGIGPAEVSPLQLLVVTDRIPDDFLVDATAETLRWAEHNYGTNSFNLMGEGGPYDDVPEGVRWYTPPGVPVDLPIGEYWNQTEPGRYGRPADDPSLVLLNLIGERDPEVMLDLMDTLGPDDADALLRPGGHVGVPPLGWFDDGYDRLTEILYQTADPTFTGDPELSDRAALWILHGAGNPGPGAGLAVPPPVGDAVELILLDRPTAIVQSPWAGEWHVLAAGVERGTIDDDLDAATIDNAIEAVFRGGEGDQLLALQSELLPTAVLAALELGDGDPAALAPPEWLGEIDGRIELGLRRAEVAEAASLDARNARIQSVTGTVAEGVLGVLIPGGGAAANAAIDQAVGLGLDYGSGHGFFPTSAELETVRRHLTEADAEAAILNYRLLVLLWEQGRVDLDGQTPAEYVRSGGTLSTLEIVGTYDDNGEPFTAGDWAEAISGTRLPTARSAPGISTS